MPIPGGGVGWMWSRGGAAAGAGDGTSGSDGTRGLIVWVTTNYPCLPLLLAPAAAQPGAEGRRGRDGKDDRQRGQHAQHQLVRAVGGDVDDLSADRNRPCAARAGTGTRGRRDAASSR